MAQNYMNRRAFLKSTLAGFGSFIIHPFPREYQTYGIAAKYEKGEKSPYRVLGRTGIKVPVISMGVMNTSNPALVKAALDAGMYFLDTAQTYQRGTNEAMIGEVLKVAREIHLLLLLKLAYLKIRPPAFILKKQQKKLTPKKLIRA